MLRKKSIVALLTTAIMVFNVAKVSALDYYVPDYANSVTTRFHLTDPDASGEEFTMLSEDGELLIHISGSTLVYFEDYVPLSDNCDGVTRMARDVLFGRTLAEVLEGRNLRVLYRITADSIPAQTSPISVEILFESIAIPQPEPIDLDEPEDSGTTGAGVEVGWTPVFLNGEIVVNNEIIANAPAPVLHETEGGIVMVPLRGISEALGYDVSWNEDLQSVQLGVAVHLWIGSTEAHRGRMAPIEISTAPMIIDGATFVPLDFFRDVLAQTVYVFEGQVVIETYSDMM
ncbi:MAG: copper amine oxidase N-terminal domain-containing protein [Defluviitaleaceae bacterium]|nr:copper amine oxidase N-terminal domain-containing protein [Defluviitaleaceae bacterium]